MSEQANLARTAESITAALNDDQDAVVDAVAAMDEEYARKLWSALSLVLEQIEAADGGHGDGVRPWEVDA